MKADISRSLNAILADLEPRLAYFEALVGPDGDCGESCTFVTINDLRVIVRALPNRRVLADAARRRGGR